MSGWCRRGVLCAAALIVGTGAAGAATSYSVEDLRGLSIEDLAQIEVTTVSRRPEALSTAPASVFVITSDDIRRSGATSLPEVLRLAPNLEVARVSASSYAISARGFNSFQAANKLLVLIDGRSIYTPFHGGVFWDQQQVLLEDIDHIEVISGPGGTLWGANAVNGVINIITKAARDTEGGVARVQAGTADRSLAARWGTKIGKNGALRVYGLGFRRDNTYTGRGQDVRDDFRGRQGGFRFDWGGAQDNVTFQGDLYRNPYLQGGRNSGGNLLVRWNRQLGQDSGLELQAYYDRANRLIPGVTDRLDTFDIEGQHSFRLGNHAFIWGGGYRRSDDEFRSGLNAFVVRPVSKAISIGNLFVQDTISLPHDVSLVLGTKLEYSSYSGVEYLPNIRVGWQVNERDFLWAAISRAVRTPSRIDRDLVAPGLFDRAIHLQSEKLIAYETGYRAQPSRNFSVSASLFYNHYDDLRIITLDSKRRLTFGNAMKGRTYGVESWADLRLRDWWRLTPGVNFLKKDLRRAPQALPLVVYQHAGNDPETQFFLRSAMNLTDRVELDLGLRAIDDLPNPHIPSYVAVDARLGWIVSGSFEVWIAGSDLFDRRHFETGDPGALRAIPRSVYAGARWRF